MKEIVESTWYGIGSFLPGVLFLVTVIVTCVLLHEDTMTLWYGIPLATAALLGGSPVLVLCHHYVDGCSKAV